MDLNEAYDIYDGYKDLIKVQTENKEARSRLIQERDELQRQLSDKDAEIQMKDDEIKRMKETIDREQAKFHNFHLEIRAIDKGMTKMGTDVDKVWVLVESVIVR